MAEAAVPFGQLAKVYYDSGLSVGQTASIANYLSTMGYETDRDANPTVNTYLSALGENQVIYSATHGGPGVVQLASGSILSSNTVKNNYSNLGNLMLAYIQGCQTGGVSTVNGSFPSDLETLGVWSSVTFEQNVSAYTDSDGIHYFSNQVFYNLYRSNTVSMSVQRALVSVYAAQGMYFGADSVIVKGGNTKIY